MEEENKNQEEQQNTAAQPAAATAPADNTQPAAEQPEDNGHGCCHGTVFDNPDGLRAFR